MPYKRWTRRDQKRFVRELLTSVKADVDKIIKAGKIPPEWDSWELRRLLADVLDQCRPWTLRRGESIKRKRDYNRVVLERDLT